MFADQLAAGIAETGGRLCVGLDPHPLLLPERFRGDGGTEDFLRWVITETSPHACAFKPNAAFFEALGSRGIDVLGRVIEVAHASGRGVILDAKRGDISSTAQAYAKAAKRLEADAMTVVPYMGEDAVRPFLEAGLFVYVLALPSNASAPSIACHGEPPICVLVAEMASRLEGEFPRQVGLVVGATQAAWVSAVHAASPELPWLVPGIGAQGGDLRAFRAAAEGHGEMIFNASRAVLGSADPGGTAEELRCVIGGAGS
jgi:orotidine-5'-phosphate decarboxylase